MADGMTAVFVYGSLKRGGYNHGMLEGCEFLGKALTEMDLTLYKVSGAFPGMVAEEGAYGVEGEVYLVDRPTLRRIDVLEGTRNGLYERIKVSLTTLPGFPFGNAWAYRWLLGTTGCERVGSTWLLAPARREV